MSHPHGSPEIFKRYNGGSRAKACGVPPEKGRRKKGREGVEELLQLIVRVNEHAGAGKFKMGS